MRQPIHELRSWSHRSPFVASPWARLPLTGLGVLALSACSSELVVVKQADPNPLEGASVVVLAPLVWEGAEIDGDSESVYVAEQGEDGLANFAEDKDSLRRSFETVLQTEALMAGLSIETTQPKGRVVPTVIPRMEEVDTGGFMDAADVTIRVELKRADGSVIDEIVVQGDSWAEDSEGHGVGQVVMFGVMDMGAFAQSAERRSRMNKAAVKAARVLVEYLTDRVKP